MPTSSAFEQHPELHFAQYIASGESGIDLPLLQVSLWCIIQWGAEPRIYMQLDIIFLRYQFKNVYILIKLFRQKQKKVETGLCKKFLIQKKLILAHNILTEYFRCIIIITFTTSWSPGCNNWDVGCNTCAAGCNIWAVCCNTWAAGCNVWAVGCNTWAVGSITGALGCDSWEADCNTWTAFVIASSSAVWTPSPTRRRKAPRTEAVSGGCWTHSRY